MDTIVDKLLIDKIEENKVEIVTLQEQVGNIELLINQLKQDNRDYLKSYQDACPHTLGSKKVPVSYMSGGYDHVSEERYEIVCIRCNMVTASKLVRGTYA